MKLKHFILIFAPVLLFAQKPEDLTAQQILDASLAFCGGEAQISKIQSSKINYLLIEPDQSTAIINEQLKTGEKYVQSILSKTHVPQTTFFDGKKISRVDGNTVKHISDIKSQEEIKLKTYNQIQYGYKKLKYKLSRAADEAFKNFDCFVVKATAANGYMTINFFDKTNFRLLMVVYPNGNKSAMIEYIVKDDVLFNSHIVNTFAGSEDLQILKLHTIDLNVNISDSWFDCPYTDKIDVPERIKLGKFKSTNGAETTFDRTATAMDYTNDKGEITLKRLIKWNAISPDTFVLVDEDAVKGNIQSGASEILVRIVSWDKNGYVCQWLTDKYTDTQDYKRVE
jgi:hypothetical protein